MNKFKLFGGRVGVLPTMTPVRSGKIIIEKRQTKNIVLFNFIIKMDE